MRFIAFDLETTGTLPGVDQIVEIGAVRFVNGAPDAVFSSLINPGVSMPEAASRVNGITDEMLVGKPKITEMLEPFAEFCGEDVMVAHNAPFDTQFLAADIKRFETNAPRGVVLDTCAMARAVFRGLANYRLGTVVQHLNIQASEFHRAEQDASYCGQVFWKMLNHLAVSGAFPPLPQLISLTGKPELRFPKVEKQPKQLGFLDGLL